MIPLIDLAQPSTMKYVVALLLLALTSYCADAQALRGGQISVQVSNPIELERPDEVVSLDWSKLKQQLPAIAEGRVRVVDAGTGHELPVQTVDNDGDATVDELLFLAGYFPGQSRAFTVEAVAPETPAKQRAFVMHYEPRDDVAWENERVAFRTYGEGLWELEDLISSGIDVWTKRTRDLVVDSWYKDGHYHTDTGQGADFFAVGTSVGAGGTAVWANGEMYRAPNFKGHGIIANGPLRAVLELHYGPFEAGDRHVEETKRITIDAGEHAFRSESTFQSDVDYVTGLVEREGVVMSTNSTDGWTWLSGWGPVAQASGGHGDLGTAVLVPSTKAGNRVASNGQQLVRISVRQGQPSTHYVASGWTASGEFDGPEEWWAYLNNFARRLNNPLKISYDADPMSGRVEKALDRAHEQLKPFLDDPVDPDAIPRSVNADGTFHGTESSSWTSGFYPGILWYLYEATGDTDAAAAARRWTAAIEPEKHNAGTHDLGFMIYNSFGNGYRLTGEPHYIEVIVDAANTLKTRFNAEVGAIRSWDFGDWQYPVIIDNMMNLELLFAATRLTGDSSYYDVAVQHARTTLNEHFRGDYSSVHVVDFDTLTGKVLSRTTHQGLSDESAWSRGQAWALYGFAESYRETGDEAFLAQARRIADFILSHPNLPEDHVPFWDFDAPEDPDEPRDASAAAIAASALYELSRYVRGDERARYVEAADRMLTSLASDAYQAPEGTPGPFLLAHSTGSVPGKFEVDVPIIYAEYYYLEALLRRRRL